MATPGGVSGAAVLTGGNLRWRHAGTLSKQLAPDAGALDAKFPSFLCGDCGADGSMGRIYGALATRKAELDNDRGRGRRAGDIGLRQYQLLFLQVLRGPGEFKERALQDSAETVRGADGSKQVHGFAWPSLSSGSCGAVAVPL